jgi:hypothetical protein
MPMPVDAHQSSSRRDDDGHDSGRQFRFFQSLQVFGIAGKSSLKCLVKGQVDGIGTQPRLRVKGADDAILVDRTYASEAVGDVSEAIGVAQ